MHEKIVSLTLGALFAVAASGAARAGEPAAGAAKMRLFFDARAPERPVLLVAGGPAFGEALVATDDGMPVGRLALDRKGSARMDLPAQELVGGLALRAVARGAGAPFASARIVLREVTAEGSRSDELVITEIMNDPTMVADTAGEFLEIHNPHPYPIDISGWILSDLGSDSTTIQGGGQRVSLRRGVWFVLGRNGDPLLNGNVPVDYVYTGFTLSNGDDEVILSRPDGSVVDMVAYDDALGWPNDAGRSMGLNPNFLSTAANDLPDNWCSSITRLHPTSVDTGTPGKPNDACPGS